MITESKRLHHYFEKVLAHDANKVYIHSTLRDITYNQLYKKAEFLKDLFFKSGIKRSDRVVIYSSKNDMSVSCMIACSLCDCIYVPVAISNPAERAAFIINETGARFVLCDESASIELQKVTLDKKLLYKEENLFIYSLSEPASYVDDKSAAFILFTSGSTGNPKGVVISHKAAMTFVDWAGNAFKINSLDRISSIAPFNFDLSVFDIYVTASKAATMILYTEEETKNALLIAQLMAKDMVSVIYATPTFLTALAYYGRLQKYEFDHLKQVLFAGEVFYMQHFKKLLSVWPDKKYINLYGPTETNVVTYYEVELSSENIQMFPIGHCCPYAGYKIIDDRSLQVTNIDQKGELCISGDSLFVEYWMDKNKTNHTTFFDEDGNRYYRTGDIVYLNEEEELVYVARKDKMIKKNGYRIEPSEIENVVSSVDSVSSAAVVYSSEKNQIICFVEFEKNTVTDELQIREFCVERLPLYMIPDKFVILSRMPTTVSGKIDIQSLNSMII